MLSKGRPVTEGLATLGAVVRFLPGVCLLMLSEV